MNKWPFTLLIVCTLLISSACNDASSPPDSGEIQQLRISNTGIEDIEGLFVLFPGSTPAETVRIDFGDVPAGETTEYQSVPTGVYRYAAYEYTLGGTTVHQSVIDWVGEQSLEGVQFTYEILLDTARVQGDQIQLVNIFNENSPG